MNDVIENLIHYMKARPSRFLKPTRSKKQAKPSEHYLAQRTGFLK